MCELTEEHVSDLLRGVALLDELPVLLRHPRVVLLRALNRAAAKHHPTTARVGTHLVTDGGMDAGRGSKCESETG